MQLRDWIVVMFAALALVASTAYIFRWHDDAVFMAWCGLVTGIATAYHLVITWDQKRPDAPC